MLCDQASSRTGKDGDQNDMSRIHDVMVKTQYGPYGIELLNDSWANDGSKAWIVISRGVDRQNQNK